MLTIEGQPVQLCDRLPRRSFLKIGSLAAAGFSLSLADILRAEQQNGTANRHKSVIMIFLAGGPPHQDMVDLKPDAPREVRGEFSPINTNVPGIQISELMPKVAAMMDKWSVIRSLVGAKGGHDAFQCCTGRDPRAQQPAGKWPSMGSTLSWLQGPVDPAVPPYVDLSQKMAHGRWNIKGPGFLGMAHERFRPDGESMTDMKLEAVTPTRFGKRTRLLHALDQFRHDVDAQRQRVGYDTFTDQALNVLTSSKLVEALNLEREDPRVRERYGKDDPQVLGYNINMGYPALMSKFLMARRAVEAGARCVTCSFAHFDWHGNNFGSARKVVPLLDQGIAALVEDLHQRGMDKDVTVLVWGEFGRTPKINPAAGRDHWRRVHAALLAGGGMRTGQVIGSTNRLAEEPLDRPIHMQEVLATVYHNLGIDVANTTLPDLTGRPQYLLDYHDPIPELV